MKADIPMDALAGNASGPSGNRSPFVTGGGSRCNGAGHVTDTNDARSGRAVGV